MFVASVAFALAMTTAPPDELYDAGVESNHHILVSVASVPDRPSGPFTATLFAVPVNWPANHSTYEAWIAEYDCTARSRKMRVRFVFSGRRDPVRTVMEDAPTERGGTALESQLDILCGDRTSSRSSRRSYNNVGEFTRSLRQ